jgi:hypothetical protein
MDLASLVALGQVDLAMQQVVLDDLSGGLAGDRLYEGELAMATTTNGTHRFPQAADEQDWAAWLDYAADQRRWPPDQRTPCQNPDCAQLTQAQFCSESCREHTEGPDHEDVLETEGQPPTAEPSQNSDAKFTASAGKNGVSAFPFSEAPTSATVRLTIAGHADVLFTRRDLDEHRLLRRLEALLQRFPLEPKTQACTPPTPSQTPVCTWHGAMKESVKAPGTWYCPNRMADGSYCQERWPAKDGRRR